ncbi:39S ribosomal protein L49 [Schistosoma japonicum]|uniref:Large ribosomal subunit protein mL49 n=1 Tax=Schistosoma japonicum TaxID=6182 RepID=A0A4Z2DCC5_SCHJA|nr:39S ribosomal protein L49 [Schistosoma japonicum]TNN14106.1 39S ribosomal protein L49 [Schistosoma japonicum]
MLPGIVLCSRLLKSASAVQAFNRYVRVKWWPTLENPWVEDSLDDDDLLKRKSVDYEVGKEEYVWVEKILKKNKIPFPEDIVNPTPSGWIPPNPELSKDVPYSVRRSKNHMLPVYYKEKQRKRKEHSHGTRQLTVIRHVDGDIHCLSIVTQYLSNGKIFTYSDHGSYMERLQLDNNYYYWISRCYFATV